MPTKAGQLQNTPAIFVVDGMRPHLYSSTSLADAQGSYFDLMRNYFMAEAQRLGYEVIDMEPVFEKHYKAHGKPFEFPTDGHWNELGHELAAQKVLESRTFRRVLGSQR